MSTSSGGGVGGRRLLTETAYVDCMRQIASFFEAKPGLEPFPLGAREPKTFLREVEPLLLDCVESMMPHAAILSIIVRFALMTCLRRRGFVLSDDVNDLATALFEKMKTCAEEEVEAFRKREGAITAGEYKRVNMFIVAKCIKPVIDCIDAANAETYQSLIAAAPQRT